MTDREEFEAWISDRFTKGVIGFGIKDNGEYLDLYTHFMWEAWQAGRKSQLSIHDEIAFVGYTNGYQLLYATADEGAFYSNTEGDCTIPLYMLKTHWHRVESTSGLSVTFESLQEIMRGRK